MDCFRWLHGGGSQSLSVPQRLAIIKGVGDALAYLHSRQKPLIHRDIKTANILLDDSFEPKVSAVPLHCFNTLLTTD